MIRNGYVGPEKSRQHLIFAVAAMNSRVSLLSHVMLPISCGFSRTALLPGALGGGWGSAGVRTMTTKLGVVNFPLAVMMSSSISRRVSAFTVVREGAWASPKRIVTR